MIAYLHSLPIRPAVVAQTLIGHIKCVTVNPDPYTGFVSKTEAPLQKIIRFILRNKIRLNIL